MEEAPGNTSFRMATFKIAGKGCVAIEKDGEHATFALSAGDTGKLIKRSGSKFEPIRKAGDLIGVRVALTALSTQEVNLLLAMVHSKTRKKN